jgi:CelD/BcsL family acetyltransferase involved in cellulose biosynthesis
MAIGRYGAQGYSYYDFLAGDAMYKRSLADDHITLAWVDLRLGRYPAGVQNA